MDTQTVQQIKNDILALQAKLDEILARDSSIKSDVMHEYDLDIALTMYADHLRADYTKWNQDLCDNKFDVTFSRAEVLGVIGDRLIRIGDIIIIPHNSLVLNAKRFRVLHVAEKGNYKYRWIYLNITVFLNDGNKYYEIIKGMTNYQSPYLSTFQKPNCRY